MCYYNGPYMSNSDLGKNIIISQVIPDIKAPKYLEEVLREFNPALDYEFQENMNINDLEKIFKENLDKEIEIEDDKINFRFLVGSSQDLKLPEKDRDFLGLFSMFPKGSNARQYPGKMIIEPKNILTTTYKVSEIVIYNTGIIYIAGTIPISENYMEITPFSFYLMECLIFYWGLLDSSKIESETKFLLNLLNGKNVNLQVSYDNLANQSIDYEYPLISDDVKVSHNKDLNSKDEVFELFEILINKLYQEFGFSGEAKHLISYIRKKLVTYNVTSGKYNLILND